MSNSPDVETHRLTLQYAPGRGALGISVRADAGECLTLLGRNGSGKSTLTRLILGLERPQSGWARVLGHRVSSGSRGHLAGIGFALDRTAHWPSLTGRQNAHFLARSYGLSPGRAKERLESLLELADLAADADRPVEVYSYGMRRKLALVQALAHDPQLLILDEPTSGLDAHFVPRLADLVRDRRERGKTTWVASNDPEWAAAVSTRIVFVDEGRVVQEGTPEQLLRPVSDQVEVRLGLDSARAVTGIAGDGVRSLSQDGAALTVLLDSEPVFVPRLLDRLLEKGVRVRTLEVRGGTLRDAFLEATGRELAE